MVDLDSDLLTYFIVFEATPMKFGPPVQFHMAMSMINLVDLEHDLLTYFLEIWTTCTILHADVNG